MCWSSGTASSLARLASCPSRSLNLVCKILISLLGMSETNTIGYYTPPVLVNELIKSALVPVIEQTLKDNPERPREALLGLRIIDPACGSGHFLLAAARQVA